jgi:transcriptional regulator with XRE-family HTH domain
MPVPAHRDGDLETLGGRLKAARLAKGLGLSDAARRIGLSRTSLNQWESNSVKNPDLEKLLEFSKLTEVSLDWLAHREGKDPDFTAMGSLTKPPGRPVHLREVTSRAGHAHTPEEPIAVAGIPEISGALSVHATGLNMTPRAFWNMPAGVVELGFHATPGSVVIQRVLTRDGADFSLKRGDYVIIDTSRNRIDEPGIYLLSDPEGKSARRALVTSEGNGLKITVIADDINRHTEDVSSIDAVVLGRVMGIFQPA